MRGRKKSLCQTKPLSLGILITVTQSARWQETWCSQHWEELKREATETSSLFPRGKLGPETEGQPVRVGNQGMGVEPSQLGLFVLREGVGEVEGVVSFVMGPPGERRGGRGASINLRI